jgi:hypothetical protein
MSEWQRLALGAVIVIVTVIWIAVRMPRGER